MVLQVGDECTICLHIYLFYMREKKLETRDHYIPDKLQISGLPATAIERP